MHRPPPSSVAAILPPRRTAGKHPGPEYVPAMASTHDVMLGYNTGYWSAGPPEGALEAVKEAERLRVRLGVDGRGVRLRCPHPARLVRARTPSGSASGPASCSSPRAPRRRRRWPRSRSTTCPADASSSVSGRRVRRSSRAGTASPIRARWPAPASTSTSCAASSPAIGPVEHHGDFYDLPLQDGTGTGQGAQVDGAPVAQQDPDLHRRRGAEERRPGRRDRRRLAADVLRPQRGRLLP